MSETEIISASNIATVGVAAGIGVGVGIGVGIKVGAKVGVGRGVIVGSPRWAMVRRVLGLG